MLFIKYKKQFTIECYVEKSPRKTRKLYRVQTLTNTSVSCTFTGNQTLMVNKFAWQFNQEHRHATIIITLMNPGKYVAHKTLILMSVAIISLMW